MYIIYYYEDAHGDVPVKDYIETIANKNDKDSRIKYHKIMDYIRLLAERGIAAEEPYIKHVDDEIWELRPLRERILFAAWGDDPKGFILLHQFMKKTQKTPTHEIETAKRRLHEIHGGKKK